MALIEFTEKGFYCPQADVYVDPLKPVNKALITHVHADHARSGHTHYISTMDSVPMLKHRLGSFNRIKGLPYGEKINVNNVLISFHPAGHIIGSAQIRLEHKGEIWVVSGDYKTEDDGLSGAFELMKCHTFITESTFGRPEFNWKPQKEVYQDINDWWISNKNQRKASVVYACSLGKAQRIINNLDNDIGNIYAHGSIENTNEVLRNQGFDIHPCHRVEDKDKPEKFAGTMIIAPPTTIGTLWIKKIGDYDEAIATGWAALNDIRKKRNVNRGFVLSDHADWNGLNEVVKETGAQQIFVTHGYTNLFTKWLCDKGYNAMTTK